MELDKREINFVTDAIDAVTRFKRFRTRMSTWKNEGFLKAQKGMGTLNGGRGPGAAVYGNKQARSDTRPNEWGSGRSKASD